VDDEGRAGPADDKRCVAWRQKGKGHPERKGNQRLVPSAWVPGLEITGKQKDGSQDPDIDAVRNDAMFESH